MHLIDAAAIFRNYYGYKDRIYSYEITPDTYKKLVEKTIQFKDIICINKGSSDQKKTMYLKECEDIGGNWFGTSGGIEMPVVSLDEDLEESIGFIKWILKGGV